MDNGDVIPNLDAPWDFLSTRIQEWIIGAIVGLIVNELFFTSAASSMPFIFITIVLTAYGLSCARRKFADGSRGFVNYCCVKMGIVPPGIPAPSELQPVWSGAPMRRIKSDTLYMQLGFDEFFLERKEEKLKQQEGRL